MALIIGIALVIFGALIGVILMALLQINRIAEPIGIVEEFGEEDVLP